ncbi:hypothetical protein, partial [Borreliella garinii]|uniref:hypothetical protein n=1 Tax=Borreliella garinii TaxID=29519 RepID=UPI001AEE2A29
TNYTNSSSSFCNISSTSITSITSTKQLPRFLIAYIIINNSSQFKLSTTLRSNINNSLHLRSNPCNTARISTSTIIHTLSNILVPSLPATAFATSPAAF